jgi:hypothetical protein
MKREEGFYWIKLFNEWTIGYFRSGCWTIEEYRIDEYRDEHLQVVDETIIVRK